MNPELTIQLGCAGSSLQVVAEGLSHPGGRSMNEDTFGHWQHANWWCGVVADGAGGHLSGDVASLLAVRALHALFNGFGPSPAVELEQLVRQINAKVLSAQSNSQALADMHTTIVCLVIDKNRHQAVWAHAGDSRLYHVREGSLIHQTKDHSVLQWMRDTEPDTVIGTDLRPERNALYSALGEPDAQLIVSVTPSPVRLQLNDQFLLCSDGLWENLINQEIAQPAAAYRHKPHDYLEQLQQLALGRAGGRADNLTGLAVSFK